MDLWNDDEPINDRFVSIEVPAWINNDISPADVAEIVRGGCASGAYMPAVTYYKAAETMAKHGDEVLDYINDRLFELPMPSSGVSWSGIAVHFLSIAVELWAIEAHSVLESADEPEEAPCDHHETNRSIYVDIETCNACGSWRRNNQMTTEPAGEWSDPN